MPFLEIEFPTAIAFLAKGGPSFFTTVNKGFSGFEQRNQNWALALAKWEISLQSKPQSYFQNVYDFWLNAAGQANAFRFKDHKDFSATAQPIGTGDGLATEFQLQRKYPVGSSSYVKPIKKPITSAVLKYDGTYCEDTVAIYLDGSEQGSGWTVDPTTGIVTFASAPTGAITADFEFHYPARFDMDDCQAVVEESDVAGGAPLVTWAGVQIMEVRL